MDGEEGRQLNDFGSWYAILMTILKGDGASTLSVVNRIREARAIWSR